MQDEDLSTAGPEPEQPEQDLDVALTFRCQLLSERLGQDTAQLDNRAALRLTGISLASTSLGGIAL
jgi:hypothetical protein